MSKAQKAGANQQPEQNNLSLGDSSSTTLLNQAVEIVAGQLAQLRELASTANRLVDNANAERRHLYMVREELDYRLRYLEKAGKVLDAEAMEQQQQNLHIRQEMLDQRDFELNELQTDVEDASKRLSLLIRQLEIASSQLTRSKTASTSAPNAWEIALRAQLIEGQEEERKRLAREVHDGPAQVLANAVMRLEHCSQILRKDKSRAQSELAELTQLMRESLLDVRRFMFNLQPKALAQQGLSATLQEYCSDFSNEYKVETEVDLPELSGVLTADQELAIFRVVQESLQNVRKHAAANKVQIFGARSNDNKLTISVKDDGKGFIPQTAELSGMTRGAGLPGMRERAALAGGQLKVKSSPGQGTEISLTISLALDNGSS